MNKHYLQPWQHSLLHLDILRIDRPQHMYWTFYLYPIMKPNKMEKKLQIRRFHHLPNANVEPSPMNTKMKVAMSSATTALTVLGFPNSEKWPNAMPNQGMIVDCGWGLSRLWHKVGHIWVRSTDSGSKFESNKSSALTHAHSKGYKINLFWMGSDGVQGYQNAHSRSYTIKSGVVIPPCWCRLLFCYLCFYCSFLNWHRHRHLQRSRHRHWIVICLPT